MKLTTKKIYYLLSFQFVFLTFCFLFVSPVSPVSSSLLEEDTPNEVCLKCHDDRIDAQRFEGASHKDIRCSSCHTGMKSFPCNKEDVKKVHCSVCHRLEAVIYYSSDHGQAVRRGIDAAACQDCHGEPHYILGARHKDSSINRKNIPNTCSQCHEDQKKMSEFNLLEKSPLASYSETVHGKIWAQSDIVAVAVCTDCHGSHDLHNSNNPDSKLHQKNIPFTCGKCHEDVLNLYKNSAHGKSALAGNREAPVCTDCHGEHTIQSPDNPDSSVYVTTVSNETCGGCHSVQRINDKYNLPEDRIETYFDSYHGLANKYGVKNVATCVSCHGYHSILSSEDPDSTIHKDNLPKTCGACHSNVSDKLSKGKVHVAMSPEENLIVYVSKIGYILLIFAVVGGMLFHNFLDFQKKFGEYIQKKKEKEVYSKFNRNERIQHLILAITFILLAYTGFALRYSESWWALPLNMFNFEYDWRGILHRAVAVVFCGLGVFHLCFLSFTRRGHQQFVSLMPNLKDGKDMIQTIKYNVGAAKHKPRRKRYTYAEKMEYWALMWGTVVMIVTGSMLAFNHFTLGYFPKWVFDVAGIFHFYEAILATLAILVWHFYFTIFDISHYPLDFHMWIGKGSKDKKNKYSKKNKSGK